MSPPLQSRRVESIDLLRGITILVMLFVNDVAGVTGTPAWMLHVQPPDADGMTFVDIVFPAFLFIVGMSLPYAIRRRLERGATPGQLWAHVLVRTLSLLVIGVFMVNIESMSGAGPLPEPVWVLLMYAGVILVWNRPSAESADSSRPTLQRALRGAGVALLLLAAVLYRGPGDPGLIELRPQWWGILGLIGWAYLVACLVYTTLGRSTAAVLGAAGLLYALYLADAGGLFAGLTWVTRWVGIGGMLGTHAAITVSGVVLGMMLRRAGASASEGAKMRWALFYGAGLAAAAFLLHAMHDVHPAFIFNKIFATPPWGLWSSAVTVWVWVAIYWVVDVRGWKGWTPLVEPAGRNALFAFILAPVAYALFSLSGSALGFDWYAALGSRFAVGFWRSLVFAFAMTWLAGALRHVGIRLKL